MSAKAARTKRLVPDPVCAHQPHLQPQLLPRNPRCYSGFLEGRNLNPKRSDESLKEATKWGCAQVALRACQLSAWDMQQARLHRELPASKASIKSRLPPRTCEAARPPRCWHWGRWPAQTKAGSDPHPFTAWTFSPPAPGWQGSEGDVSLGPFCSRPHSWKGTDGWSPGHVSRRWVEGNRWRETGSHQLKETEIEQGQRHNPEKRAKEQSFYALTLQPGSHCP